MAVRNDADLTPYFRALDSMRKLMTRNPGAVKMPDDFYVSYLMSFTDVEHMPSARCIVAEWKAKRTAEKDVHA